MASKAEEEVVARFNNFIAGVANHEKANLVSCLLNGVAYLLNVVTNNPQSPDAALCGKLMAEKPRWSGCYCKGKDETKLCPTMQLNIRRAVGYLVALISRNDGGRAIKIYLGRFFDLVEGVRPTEEAFVKLQSLKTLEARETVLQFAPLVPTEAKIPIPDSCTLQYDPAGQQATCYLLALLVHDSVRPAVVKFMDNYLLATSTH